MRVLLVEPNYRKLSAKRRKLVEEELPDDEVVAGADSNEDTLWYPPLGLMKLARFHRDRKDEVKFVRGWDRTLLEDGGLFAPAAPLWDRVYITTLFTFHFDKIVETINFYKEAVGGTAHRIYVGGIMSSLMPKAIHEESGIYPIPGIITSPRQIGLDGDTNIDLLPPDYSILDGRLYAINDTYYAYCSRGCVNSCPWCGVPHIEPGYVDYIDIKPIIRALRDEHKDDKSRLKLMDNNVLASPHLPQIVDDLLELGYGRNDMTKTKPPKQRVVDFNQGLDASFLTEERMKLLSRLNIKPMRIAFDRATEKKVYVAAVRLARSYGVTQFSNYLLYNWKDTPHDLYDRLLVNIELNEEWAATGDHARTEIYSYPMRYAPIDESNGPDTNRCRDYCPEHGDEPRDWLIDPVWTKRFVRSIEIMKGAAHGAISPTPTLARRTIGETFEEFVANLYMPEELLRNRNRHEERVYADEPDRRPGTGRVEAFRAFILTLIRQNNRTFHEFHKAVAANKADAIRAALRNCRDQEVKAWLDTYLRK